MGWRVEAVRAVVRAGWVVAAMGMAVVRAAAVRAAAMVAVMAAGAAVEREAVEMVEVWAAVARAASKAAVSQARRPYPMHAHEHRLAVIK